MRCGDSDVTAEGSTPCPEARLGGRLREVKPLLAADRDLLRPLVQAVVQELLEAEMTEALGAEKGARTPGQGDHPGALRPQLLGRGDQRDQRPARRGAGPVCAAPAR